MELEPNISEEQRQSEKENPFLIDEQQLQNEKIEGRGLTCKPQRQNERFWNCNIETNPRKLPHRKNIMPKIDAVNVKTENAKTQTRATRVAKTGVRAEEGEQLEISGTCRESNSTTRGTFCELLVEEK